MTKRSRPPGLIQRYPEELQARHDARRTVKTYEQWLQHRRWQDPTSEQQGRHHLDPSLIQKLVRSAVLAAGISKPASCHSLRH
jgi:hypothetical protein